MKNILVLSSFLMLSLALIGCEKNQNQDQDSIVESSIIEESQNQKEVIEDCGISLSMKETERIFEANYEDDKALQCIGSKILNDCEKGSVKIETYNMGIIEYSVVGKEENSCVLKVQYGEADQIGSEIQKSYANRWAQCQLQTEELIKQQPSAAEAGFLSYMKIGLQILDKDPSKFKCTGTLLEKQKGVRRLPQ